ncbi:MAG: hypothetical protein M3Q09_02355 [Gemmatimonadota bacterium]|nr:hypothetical protein [Gemmatimonadota bacterium]
MIGCSGKFEKALPVNNAQRAVASESTARTTAGRSGGNAGTVSEVVAVAPTEGSMWLVPPAGEAADIDGNTTRAHLVRRFGNANLRSAEINVGEGMTIRAVYSFPTIRFAVSRSSG